MLKKKTVLLLLVLTIFCLAGCGSKKEKNAHDNKLICSGSEGVVDYRYILYFNDKDELKSFDAYETHNVAVNDQTRVTYKEARDAVCNGEGEFPKDWIEECELTMEDNVFQMHIYIANNKWFGDTTNKDEIKKMASSTGFDGVKLRCL